MSKFGLVGNNIGYTLSPDIHNFLGNPDYGVFDIGEKEFASFIKSGNFSGLNITKPYKLKVIGFLDGLDETAKRTGSVNTVKKENGKLTGYNTDYFGLKSAIEYYGVDLKDKRVLILGTGGVSKTVRSLAKDLGANPEVISRKGAYNYDLSAREFYAQTDIIINASPMGDPLDLTGFYNLSWVIDLNYSPANSPLILSARERRIKAFSGLYMLCAQAVKAHEIFTGKTEEVLPVYAYLRKKTENLILIGMPSSGKSSVGSALAKKLGKRFIDTDDETTAILGKSIHETIKERGEEVFRIAEKKAVENLKGVRGCVIATGGGTVLNKESAKTLKTLGKIVYIKRDLSKLDYGDRPLLEKFGAEKLFEERKEIYSSLKDTEISNDDTIENTVKNLEKVLLYEDTHN